MRVLGFAVLASLGAVPFIENAHGIMQYMGYVIDGLFVATLGAPTVILVKYTRAVEPHPAVREIRQSALFASFLFLPFGAFNAVFSNALALSIMSLAPLCWIAIALTWSKTSRAPKARKLAYGGVIIWMLFATLASFVSIPMFAC
jgi:hypothetical protein